MKKTIYNIFIWSLIINIVSCSSIGGVKIQVYYLLPTVEYDTCSFNETMDNLIAFDSKYITIQNDSIMILYKNFGGLGFDKHVKYRSINNELITDSIDVSGTFEVEVQDRCFLYNKDSLVNKQTGEKFYSKRFLKVVRNR